ncbi:MAG: DMT family transporter [Granulosicoccus sp.]
MPVAVGPNDRLARNSKAQGMRTILLTMCALLAFAGNSILCRLALGDELIDAASFTWIRLLSGIVILAVALRLKQASSNAGATHEAASEAASEAAKGSWKASLMLFVYAICFSLAYVSLDTGVGALILFAMVQLTMIIVGLHKGNRFHWIEWLGVLVAFSGLVYLVLPGLSAPPVVGAMLMSLAGVAWGFYTLAGQGSSNPLRDTAYNFARTWPLLFMLMLFSLYQSSMSSEGILLAVVSGGLTSGLGYTIWYMALGGLSAIQAAVLQLLVPVIAALGGVVFVNEAMTLRLLLASLLILGGILTVIVGKQIHFRQTSRTV